MPRVLVVDDEKDLRSLLEYNLVQAGFSVVTAENGREALERVRESPPDLVLLDVLLPDMPGTEVLKALRRSSPRPLPILMLTAKGEEIDRVLGLELGADDYVVKPFSVRELILRVRALLRRAEPTEVGQARFEFREIAVDVERHQVTVSTKPVDLTALEFRLLTTLLNRRGRVQTRQALLTDVWGLSADLATRTVDTHIKRLREKLGVAGAYVETVRGVGYRFAENEESA
jgi:two-component system, OmpR family, phosphate regulon response regulator PhoB